VEHYKTVEELQAEMSGTPLIGESADPVQKIRRKILATDDESRVTSKIIKSWLREE